MAREEDFPIGPAMSAMRDAGMVVIPRSYFEQLERDAALWREHMLRQGPPGIPMGVSREIDEYVSTKVRAGRS